MPVGVRIGGLSVSDEPPAGVTLGGLIAGYLPTPQVYGPPGLSADEFPMYGEVVIGDYAFQINTSFEPYRRDAFRHRSIAAQRESINLAGTTGEGTVNTEGLWRATGTDWKYGAGQLFYDRKDSVGNRFLDSYGVDPFTTEYQVSLLPSTELQLADQSNTPESGYGPGQVLAVGDVVFYWNANTKKIGYSTNGPAGPYVTIYTASYFIEGNYSPLQVQNGLLYWADGAHGVYSCNATSSPGSPVHVITSTVDSVFCCADRVLCSQGPNLYDITNVTEPATLPSPLMVHNDPNWVWTCAAAGSSNIYIGGYDNASNTNANIYRTAMESDGTALTAPVIALPMLGGELPMTLYSYLNYIFIGTNLGIRMTRTVSANDPEGATGDLISGPIIPNLLHPTPQPVYGIVGWNKFIYYTFGSYGAVGLNNAEAYGLGVLNLQTLTEDLAPAYTSHLMIESPHVVSTDFNPNAGIVSSVTIYQDQPLFTIFGAGLYGPNNDSLVPQGWVDQGVVTYNIPDDKIACQGLIRNWNAYQSGPYETSQYGTVAMSINADNTGFQGVNPLSPNSEAEVPILMNPTIRGENLDIKIWLYPDATDLTEGPIVTRWTLKSWPAVVSGTTISVVALNYETMKVAGVERQYDPYALYAYLEGLRLQQTIVTYQEGPYTAKVVVQELDWLPYKRRDTTDFGFEGDIVIYLTSIVG